MIWLGHRLPCLHPPCVCILPSLSAPVRTPPSGPEGASSGCLTDRAIRSSPSAPFSASPPCLSRLLLTGRRPPSTDRARLARSAQRSGSTRPTCAPFVASVGQRVRPRIQPPTTRPASC
eukprot:1485247-Rhodomonas_salina.1